MDCALTCGTAAATCACVIHNVLPSCQVGGGDQIYCDPVFELPALKPWLTLDDPHVSANKAPQACPCRRQACLVWFPNTRLVVQTASM
jgi:hypothetical protein